MHVVLCAAAKVTRRQGLKLIATLLAFVRMHSLPSAVRIRATGNFYCSHSDWDRLLFSLLLLLLLR
jgi:hypothetical protein